MKTELGDDHKKEEDIHFGSDNEQTTPQVMPPKTSEEPHPSPQVSPAANSSNDSPPPMISQPSSNAEEEEKQTKVEETKKEDHQ